MQKEEMMLTRIYRAENEIDQLRTYSIAEIPELLGIPVAKETMDANVLEFYSSVSIGHQTGWLVAFTSEFMKDISHIGDKKKEGRILNAIIEICEQPIEPRGDTVKPLSGPLKGRWRFRIGDYRLVYCPDDSKHVVYLLLIDTRGDVYG